MPQSSFKGAISENAAAFADNLSQQNYLPPVFADSHRLAKMQTFFPTIDEIYKEAAEKNHFPGYAFGIMVDGKLVHSGSGGYTDIDKKIPATTRSMFRIASMTKSFTAMAILKLRDEGKLKLDDPVGLYIPEIENQRLTQDTPVITIRDLLTHSAGFPSDDPWGDRKLNETEEELLALLKNGIYFSNVPGTTYEYSNLGYTMLGYIIQKVSSLPFGKYIEENIWQPLNMDQASWEYTEIESSQLVRGYRRIDENWKEEEMLSDGIFGAMGGMIASIESFSRYAALHQNAWPPRDDRETGPLKRSTIREMHQPWRFIEFIQEGALARAYGFGLSWARDSDGVYVGHSGGLPGFGSNWCIMPEYGIGAILFANATYARADKVNCEVLDTLMKAAQLKPRQLLPSRILKERKNALIQMLPDWDNAATCGLFATNFFLDYSLDALKKETQELFARAGQILQVGDIVPDNQLRGYFLLECENIDLRISFALAPENPALIQSYQIKEEVKKN